MMVEAVRPGWRTTWMILATFGVVGAVFWLVRTVALRAAPTDQRQESRAVPLAVRAERDGTIVVPGDSPLREHMSQLEVQLEKVSFPILTVRTALGGEAVGTLYEGERRFDIVARPWTGL